MTSIAQNSGRQLRKACDECHAIKVRCVPVEESPQDADPNARSTCKRCTRLGIACNFSYPEVVVRRKKRKVAPSDTEAAAGSSNDVAGTQSTSTSGPTSAGPSTTSPPFGSTSLDVGSSSALANPLDNVPALTAAGGDLGPQTVDWNSLFAAFPSPLADPGAWEDAAAHDTCTHGDPFSTAFQQKEPPRPQMNGLSPAPQAGPSNLAKAGHDVFAATDAVFMGPGFPMGITGSGAPITVSTNCSSGPLSTPGLTNSCSSVATPSSFISNRDGARLALSKLSAQFSILQHELSHTFTDEGIGMGGLPRLKSIADTVAAVANLSRYDCSDINDDFEGSESHDPSRTEPAAAAQWKRFISPNAAFLGFSVVMQLYTCLSTYLSAPLSHPILLEELTYLAPSMEDAEKDGVRKSMLRSHLRTLDGLVDKWDEMAKMRHHDEGCVCVVQTMVVSFRAMSNGLKVKHGL